MIKKSILLGAVALSFGIGSMAAAGPQRGFNLDRVEKVYDELPVEVQTQVDDYRETRQELRDTLKNDYLSALGEDATRDEQKAAIEQFREDYAEQISANRELAKVTFESVRENLPERPELPEEVQALVDQHKGAKSDLQTALKAHLATLPEGTSREDIKAAIAAFNEENADAIAANKDLGKEIRELVRDARGVGSELSAEFANRDVLSPELEGTRDRFRNSRQDMMRAVREGRESLEGLEGEEREAALEVIKEDIREDMKELRNKRRDRVKEQIGES